MGYRQHERGHRAGQPGAAVRLLNEHEYAGQAVSRAYYATFYAAEAALAVVGESRSTHSGVFTAFSKLIIKEGGIEPWTGRYLRSLSERRGRADYTLAAVSAEEGAIALGDATRFVDAVEAWIAARPPR